MPPTDAELREALHRRVVTDVGYHAPNDAAREAHEQIRLHTETLAHLMIDLCPPGRELSLGLTKLIDEAMAHFNAAVARNHDRL
jgi:hypothetical protein